MPDASGCCSRERNGCVEPGSEPPAHPPRIDPIYLAVSEDLVDMRMTVKLTRCIARQPAFDRYWGRERGEKRVMVFSANGHRTRKGGNGGAPPDLDTTALALHSTEPLREPTVRLVCTALAAW